MTTEILKLVVAAALRPAVPVVPQRDPLVADLITALIANKSGGGGDGVDAIELQKLLNEARKEGKEEGRQLGEALSAAMGEGDGVARVLASALPSVVEAFGKAQQSYQQAGRPLEPRRPNPPTQPATLQPVHEEPAPVTTGPVWINALRPALPLMLSWARAGKDPSIKAANTVDDLSDQIREMIAVQAEEPNFVASVIEAIPEMSQTPELQTWFNVYLGTIQEMLTTADDGPDAMPVEG
jgi:hypothetical protein